MKSNSSKLGKNSILVIVARCTELISLVFIHIMLTRYLGVHDFGLYSLAISFIMVLYPIVDLGTDHIFVREVSKDKENTIEIFYSLIILKFALLFPTIIIIGIGIFYLSPETNLFWGIIIEGIATLLIRQFLSIVARAFFVAFEELKFDLILTIFCQLCKIIILLFVIHYDLGFIAAFFVILGGDIAYGLPGILIALSRYLKFSKDKKEVNLPIQKLKIKNSTVKMFKETLPIGLTLILITASFHIDVFIIKAFLSDERNGIFAAAYRIISQLIFCSVPIIWVMMPVLSRAVKTNTISKELQKGIKFILILSLPLITILYFYADFIVSFFGNDFPESAFVLKLISLVLAFRYLAYLFDLGLIALNKQRLTIIGALTIFVVNITLDILLIKPLDIYGACIGTLSADIIACILLYILLKWNLKDLTINREILKILLVGVLNAILVFLIKDFNIIISLTFSMVIYCLLIYFFRVLNKEEIKFFTDFAKKNF